MKKSFIYLVLGAILLSGCGKNHPYKKQKPAALFGPFKIGSGGYTDRALEDSHYFIRYCDAAGHQQAMHLGMIRAAEITINTGHKYFSIDSFSSYLEEPQGVATPSIGVGATFTKGSSPAPTANLGMNTVNSHPIAGEQAPSRKKVVEDRSQLASVLKKEYKPKNYGDSNFLIKDWYSLSWDANRESHYPPVVSMNIGVHNENPGYFVYDAEKVYRDLLPRYKKSGNQKSTTDLRRINYNIYQINEDTALVATVANRKKLLGMAVELNVLATTEYALSKGFQTIKLITSNTDHFKLTEYYSDFEKKDIKDYDEVFNIQKGYISYLVIKMSKEKGDDLLDCSKLKSHITARSKEIVERELERIKREKEAEKSTHIRAPKRN